ncbi:MAG: hypothetical protein M3133_07595 [Actinomycetota bacterium]|nr:hypothetical protein [Actinomycetota bacterium]
MCSAIEKARRLLARKLLKRVRVAPGEAEAPKRASLRREHVSREGVEERGGRLVIAASRLKITDADVRALRDADSK